LPKPYGWPKNSNRSLLRKSAALQGSVFMGGIGKDNDIRSFNPLKTDEGFPAVQAPVFRWPKENGVPSIVLPDIGRGERI